MTELWMNGAFVASGRVDPPALDGPATGLFETILVRAGAPVRLERHLARLAAAAGETPGLSPPDRAALAFACRALPGRAGLAGGRMRIALTAVDLAVTLAPFAGYPAAAYAEGCRAVLAPEPGHPLGARAGRKVLPYTPLLVARERARAAGAVDVLFHTADGFLLEGAASNLFVVVDREVRTPALARGVLPGIVRGATLDAARAEGLAAVETDLRLRDLDRAAEAFLTGSLMEVVPLRRVGERTLPLGPIAPRLLAAVRAAEGRA